MAKLANLKICAEATCNTVYEPTQDGLCPKCGSEGLWLAKTVIGSRFKVKELMGWAKVKGGGKK